MVQPNTPIFLTLPLIQVGMLSVTDKSMKKIISGTLPDVSNCLDPDQDQHFVGRDLGPNCLQRLSADDKSMKKFFQGQMVWI